MIIRKFKIKDECEFEPKLNTKYSGHERWSEITKLDADNKKESAANMMPSMNANFVEIVGLNADKQVTLHDESLSVSNPVQWKR
jgi:hypothetical protein